MITGPELRRFLRENTAKARKPYGMKVCAYINEKGHRTDFWDIQNERELRAECKVFHSIPTGYDHPLVKIVISPRTNRPDQKQIVLPPKGAERVLQAMEKNNYLVKVKVPGGFFDKKQNERLNTLLKHNLQAAKERKRQAQLKAQRKATMVEKRNQKQRVIWSVLGTVSALVVAVSAGFGILSVLGVSIFGSAFGFVAAKLRQTYLEKAASYYDKPNKIPSLDFDEGESLKAGVEAQYWPGWFKSFLLYESYARPVTFAAGMKHAMDGNTEITKKVKACC